MYVERKVERKRERDDRESGKEKTGREASEMYDVIVITEFITLVFSPRVFFLPPTVFRQTPQGPLSVALNRTAYFRSGLVFCFLC